MTPWKSILPIGIAGFIALGASTWFTISFFPSAQSQDSAESFEELEPLEDLAEPVADPNLTLPPPPPELEDVEEMKGEGLPQLPTIGGDQSGLLPPFNPGGYFPDIGGERNPFQPSPEVRNMRVTETKVEVPLEPLQRFELGDIKILGIMWDIREPRAMVADPTGKVHIVKQEQKLGRNNGVLALIREGELVVVEGTDPGNGKVEYQTKILAIGR